jgi:hypothetical protein
MTTMQTSFGPVSYTDEGSGPPVVLLHAVLHDRTDFAPVIDATANLPRRPHRCAPSNSAICSSNSPIDWT